MTRSAQWLVIDHLGFVINRPLAVAIIQDAEGVRICNSY